MNHTDTRKFKRVCKILDRKHQGGIDDKDIPAFINSNGRAWFRRSLRAQNRNPRVNQCMNAPEKAIRMNAGYEKIHRLIDRVIK